MKNGCLSSLIRTVWLLRLRCLFEGIFSEPSHPTEFPPYHSYHTPKVITCSISVFSADAGSWGLRPHPVCWMMHSSIISYHMAHSRCSMIMCYMILETCWAHNKQSIINAMWIINVQDHIYVISWYPSYSVDCYIGICYFHPSSLTHTFFCLLSLNIVSTASYHLSFCGTLIYTTIFLFVYLILFCFLLQLKLTLVKLINT